VTPAKALAPGLRAGTAANFILAQTNFRKETHTMLLPRWLRTLPITAHRRTGRPRPAQRFRPQLEALEARWVPSQLPLTVTSLGDSGPGTLRAAIQTADAAATRQSDNFKIDVKVSGTIDLLTPLPDLNANIAIQGPGANSLTVEQAPGASFTSTIVTVDGGQTASLSGLTIANGSAGGITNNGTLTMMACTVSGNSGFLGGGIDNNRTLTVSGCTISGNSAFEGGGIDNEGTLAIRDSFLTCNTASIGGGIANFPDSNDTTVTISGSTLSGNSATAIVLPGRVVGGVGGAIFNEGDLGSVVTVTVSDSILSNNSATLGGGGIFSDGIRQATTVTVKGCTLSCNTASQGAAIDNRVGSTLVVQGSTISGNTASDSGGGIYNAGTATLQDSTLSTNTAASAGGGIFNAASGTLTIDDSDVYDNLALLGADLYNLGQATLHDSTVGIIGP
jgi:predicted outer membrane repeat protein